MRQLAMRPIDIGPLIEHGDDLVFLGGGEPMNRVPSRGGIVEADTVGDPTTPPPQAALGQLQIPACRPHAPPAGHRLIDQADQGCLGGRIDSLSDSATPP